MTLDEAIQAMHDWLAGWLPEGAKLYGPTLFPHGGAEYVRWRADFADGTVARASFRASDLEQRLTALQQTVRDFTLLQGKEGAFRVMPGEVMPNPIEWDAWIN